MEETTSLHTLFVSLSLVVLTTFAAAANNKDPSASFITTSCRLTTYPSVCVQSLSSYASAINRDPKQLVRAALTVSIDGAESTRAFVARLARFRGLRPRERAAIKDCVELIGDSVDRLRRSLRELDYVGRARGPGFRWHVSNMQTWVSAALTDGSTCMDEFSGRVVMNGRIKASVRARVGHVAQVTSNALALCNKYASTN